MALATDSPHTDIGEPRFGWSGRLSLTRRILAVNIFALAMLAGSLFYLDSYRTRLIEQRLAQAMLEAHLIAAAIADAPVSRTSDLIDRFGALSGARLRLFDANGVLFNDTWRRSSKRFAPTEADSAAWQRTSALWLDGVIDFVVRANVPPPFPDTDQVASVREGSAVLTLNDNGSPMISARAAVGGPRGLILITDENASDIRTTVRAERSRLGTVVGVTTMLSILLSLFLARTIVGPLRMLVRAAIRVRTGRAREVVVPRLPERRDEIGMLARALSDMSHTLRERIDATEAFAADIAHELKNPLASLGSALDTMRTVKDPGLHEQLQGVARDDVRRLNRLITEISELSRIDSKLARTRFELIDFGALVAQLLAAREKREGSGQRAISFQLAGATKAMVRGDATQLERVVENLVDNASSFSPMDGIVTVAIKRAADEVILSVSDTGPGVPEAARQSIFLRFHSDRPDGEPFAAHSGLGLAIVKTVVEAHGGTVSAVDPVSGTGAQFDVVLPAAQGETE
jgi:two-component system, OmpR family, sensor histidine kinase ChvG